MQIRTECRHFSLAAILVAVLLAPAVFGGCAIMNRDNTPLLNLVEDNLWPESTGMRIVTFPVVFPAGAVAVLLDAVIVHPTMIVDDSLGDTKDVLWDNWEWDEKYVTECACLPWRTLFTPLIFTGCFLGRALFDFPERADAESRAAEDAARQEADERLRARVKSLKKTLVSDLDRVEELIDAGRCSEALDEVTGVVGAVDLNMWLQLEKEGDLLARSHFLSFAAAVGCGRLEAISTAWAVTLRDAYTRKTRSILSGMRESDDPLVRWTAFTFGMELARKKHEKHDLAHVALRDRDAAVRRSALWWVKHCGLDGISDRLVADLKRIAEEDDDPINRTFAVDLLRWVIED